MAFRMMITADKNTGAEREAWLGGIPEAAARPYSGDLNGIPATVRPRSARAMGLHDLPKISRKLSSLSRSMKRPGLWPRIRGWTRAGVQQSRPDHSLKANTYTERQ